MKNRRHDTRLLPVEKPVSEVDLWEMMADLQVARLEYDLMPDGGEAIAFEMTNGQRFIFWPVRDENEAATYRWKLILRMIPAQKIWTKRMRRHFGDERKNELGGPHRQDDLMRLIEGEVIRGIPIPPGPNSFGGEQLNIEFRGGLRLHIEAVPPRPGSTTRADLLVVPDFPASRTRVQMAAPLV